MTSLHNRSHAIGEVFGYESAYVNQKYWVDRKANIYNEYNPNYATAWSHYLRFKNLGLAYPSSGGLEMNSLKEDFNPIGDIGYGVGFFSDTDPGTYRIRFKFEQLNQPGATRAGIVEIIACSAGYISGNVDYLYRETTRLSNPLEVDMTVTVSSSHRYLCPTFIAVTKNSAPGFTGCDCHLHYLEVTKV
jgi:hypothetical protein